VTAHTYADLFDDELDDIAAALDSLDELPRRRQLNRLGPCRPQMGDFAAGSTQRRNRALDGLVG
jgi:hypothetical protein